MTRPAVEHSGGGAGSDARGGLKTWIVYIVVRGVRGNVPLSLGGFALPPAARLRLVTSQTTNLPALGYLPLATFPRGTAGAVYMVSLSVVSSTENFLEGCVRARIDGSPNVTLLSSGTEDYFQSAFYFDGGLFHFPGAGLGHLNVTGRGTLAGRTEAAMYKVHDRDALFFGDGLAMTWRNGDTMDAATLKKCPDVGGTTVWNPQPSNVTAYAYVYTW